MLTLLQCIAAAQAVQQHETVADASTGFLVECKVPFQKLRCECFCCCDQTQQCPCILQISLSIISNNVNIKSFQVTFGGVHHKSPAHQICSHRHGGHPWGRQQQLWPGWHHPSWHLRAPGQWSWAPPPLGEPPRSSTASQSGPTQHKTASRQYQTARGIEVTGSKTVYS